MKAVRTHWFNGVRFHIGVDEPYIGWCDRPGTPDPKEYPAIRLPNGLPFEEDPGAKEGLCTLLHECFHAEDWSWSEAKVDRMAVDISRLLWRLGYRRQREEPPKKKRGGS